MGGGGGASATNIMVVMVVMLSVTWLIPARAGPSAAQCKEERALGVNACRSLTEGKGLTPQCCQRVRVSHAECICPDVTPGMLALIGDVNRAVRLVERCGRRVPHHFKCGAITTP
ncbi:hypothetical protein SSX86_021793 [Deinandra increscens subsp. villosa]|uniref:Bifunctional inhibitor/plant lipid transfer protein/seed storage helical domain-containing protein n=1 Tax=Deinandra increscens subsp. villosa TaxID=3103831 RepID=A0AAP0GSX9_9ASTR